MTSREPSILLIEDNAPLADNLVEILADAGYRAATAGTCADARVASERGFSVALVDVRLPDGDGIALARELKERSPDSLIILLTGFATVESAAAAVRAGAWAYLVKPCSTHDLLLAVEQAMRQVQVLEEKRELARRAQVAEKLAAVGTLAAGLSHEIRNPLNAAGLQLAVMARRLQRLPPEVQSPLVEPLGLVQDEIRRLNRIVEDFLQFARPQELVVAPVDLVGLARSVADLLALEAERAHVTLETHLDDVPPVAGDQGRLRQALLNLVLNAVQATPPGGWVRIDVVPQGDEVRLSVEDSGPGVPPELEARIFEPFFTTKEHGSGLGLPLVHAIVRQHGGQIAIGKGEVGGARFVMELPRHRGD